MPSGRVKKVGGRSFLIMYVLGHFKAELMHVLRLYSSLSQMLVLKHFTVLLCAASARHAGAGTKWPFEGPSIYFSVNNTNQ